MDAFKPEMLAFAARHHALLDRFGRRLATGTTGSLLNGIVPERLAPDAAHFPVLLPDRPAGAPPWVDPMLSGPKGGDAQIAYEVLQGRCRRVIFLEDPHVAREHEADIQLLERATKFADVGLPVPEQPPHRGPVGRDDGASFSVSPDMQNWRTYE